jgi:serine/threonine protein kinase
MDGAAATTQYRETAAAGTFCYIDPEYQKTGLVCTKSDVYALGVIFLQMVTAREAMGLAYTVSDALEEGTFADLLDGKVTGWPVQEAQAFAELALKCCEMRRRDRPDLETVVMPELIRLHRLVSPSEYPSSSSSSLPPSMDQAHHRSASDKVTSPTDLEIMLSSNLQQRCVKDCDYCRICVWIMTWLTF